MQNTEISNIVINQSAIESLTNIAFRLTIVYHENLLHFPIIQVVEIPHCSLGTLD